MKQHHEEVFEFLRLCNATEYSLKSLVNSDGLAHPEIRQKLELCMRLITEEYTELRDAIQLLLDSKHDIYSMSVEKKLKLLTEILDGGIDLPYVVNNLMFTLGMPVQQAFEEVHRSNMKKVINIDGKLVIVRRADGKILKPEGWQPPDLAKIIKEHIK